MSRPNPVRFCLCDWMYSKVSERKTDIRDELLVRILVGAANKKKCEDQIRRTTRDLRTPVAKVTEVDGGFIERIFLTVTDLLCKH